MPTPKQHEAAPGLVCAGEPCSQLTLAFESRDAGHCIAAFAGHKCPEKDWAGGRGTTAWPQPHSALSSLCERESCPSGPEARMLRG